MSNQDNLAAQRPVSQLTYEERQAHWHALIRDMPLAYGCMSVAALETEFLSAPSSKKEGER